MNIPDREFVRQRAGHRCEYCRLRQSATPFFTFHIEHVRARQHGGSDDRENLALACPDCNAFKGPNLTAIDPITDQVTAIFHPRQQAWDEHFWYERAQILGSTATGRATVHLLQMNEPLRLELRTELLARNELD